MNSVSGYDFPCFDKHWDKIEPLFQSLTLAPLTHNDFFERYGGFENEEAVNDLLNVFRDILFLTNLLGSRAEYITDATDSSNIF